MPDVLRPVVDFFSDALSKHGSSHQAVDWPDRDQQIRRFAELSKLFDTSRPFSVLDYGCGYGALLAYLTDGAVPAAYWGYDISNEMLKAARELHPALQDRFLSELPAGAVYDYVVASGIFNLKLGIPVKAWERIVDDTIDKFDALSTRGFAFNMLTSYREPHRKRDRLYYGDPLRFFDLCFREYSPNVALAHDYNLWDFTIIVRKAGDRAR